MEADRNGNINKGTLMSSFRVYNKDRIIYELVESDSFTSELHHKHYEQNVYDYSLLRTILDI